MNVGFSKSRDNASDLNPPAKLDPQALMRIKNLTLRAKLVVEGFYHGLHRSPFHGNAIEFREYRPYTNGDDLRNLDWKLFARSDRYYIKKFEDETNLHCMLIQDQSRSMAYGSLDYNKSEYTSTVLATLAYHLHGQRDSVGLLTFDDHLKDYHPPRRTHGQLRRLMASLSHSPSGRDTDIQRPLEEIAALAKRRGLVLLASDFLTPVENLTSSLAFLRARGHQVLLIRILDPAELRFSIDAPSMIFDMETQREVYVDPAIAREDYERAFQQHRTSLKSTCQQMGIDLFEMTTDQPIEDALHQLVTLQHHRQSSASRSNQAERSSSNKAETSHADGGKA